MVIKIKPIFYTPRLQYKEFNLTQVTQLTGFSDPVYAEAYVHINQYDIVLDVLVVNQTSDTLQNCTLELATLGMHCSVMSTLHIKQLLFVRWFEVGWEAKSTHSRPTRLR